MSKKRAVVTMVVNKNRLSVMIGSIMAVILVSASFSYAFNKKPNIENQVLSSSSSAFDTVLDDADISDESDIATDALVATSNSVEVVSAATRMAMMQYEKEKSRSIEQEELNRIITNEFADPIVAASAQESLLKLVEQGRKETDAQVLLLAAGYENALVNMDLYEEKANVLIFENKLDENNVDKIGKIVSQSTGLPLHKILILDQV